MKWTEDLVRDIRHTWGGPISVKINDDDWSPSTVVEMDIVREQPYVPDREMTDCNLAAIREKFALVRNNCPAILEIGISRNQEHSACHIFFEDKLPETKYVGIDLDDREYLANEAENIHVIQDNSSNVEANMARFRDLGIESFGFIFIDGWHSINQVLTDWEYTRMLAPGGIVALHDTSEHPGPYLFIKALDKTRWIVQENACPCDCGIGFAQMRRN